MNQKFWNTSIVLFFTVNLFAQVDTSLAIPEIQVTASRVEQSLNESGRNVVVIKHEDIVRSGARSVDEAIELLGGVEVQKRGVFGSQADFSIHGSSFNQVLVLKNGQPINDPLTGHFSGNIPVYINDIDKIEVIKGPAAAIYGSNAMGGVINIITKDHLADPGIHLHGGLYYGDFDLRSYDIGGSIGSRSVAAHIGFRKVSTDGPEHEMDSLSQYMNSSTLSAGLVFEKRKVSASLDASWDSREFDARYYYTRSTFDRSEEEVKRNWMAAKIGYELSEESSLELNVSRIESSDEFAFNPAFPVNSHEMHRTDARLDWHHSWKPGISTILGINAGNRSIDSKDRGDHSDEYLAAYLIGSIDLNAFWTLTPALRFDYEDEFDLEVNPQIAIAYNRDQWNAHLFLGRSVRTADYTERYVNYGRTTVLSSGRNLGNPQLLPESAWTYEAGLKYSPFRDISVAINGFLRTGKDLIDYSLTGVAEIEDDRLLEQDGEYFFALNVSELTTTGVEFVADYDWEVGQQINGNIGLNYSIISSQTEDDVVSKYIANHAQDLVSWRASIEYNWLTFLVNGIYKNRDSDEARDINRSLDASYHVLHSRIVLSFFKDRLKGSFNVHNVFDQEYSDILGARLPGRWWSFGITLGI